MSCVWHIGDLHLGHRSITKYRDVPSVEENSVILVDNILSKVKKRDTLWLHGDIFFSTDSVYHWAPILAEGVQNIHLIMGNHDLERVTGHEKRECLVYLMSFLGYQIHALEKNNKAWLSHAPIHE